MLVLANDGQSGWIIEHIGKSFCGEEAATDESWLLGIPERIVVLVKLRNHSVFEVLFGEVLDDVVSIGECFHVPPVAVAHFAVDHLDGDSPFLHLKVLLIVVLVLQHHLDAHRDVFLEFFGDKVELNAFGQGLQQFLLEVVLFLSFFLLLSLGVDQLALLALDFFLFLGDDCLFLANALLQFNLLFFLLHLDLLPQLLALLQVALKLLQFLLLLLQHQASLLLQLPLLLLHQLPLQ